MPSFSSLTERLLRAIPLQPGMQVLDIGCGSGDVTRAIARLVGPTGLVVGIDGSEAALSQARAAPAVDGGAKLQYLRADLADLSLPPASFDCIVGRRVLMYLPDPGKTLATLLGLVRPGGALAFQEHDGTVTPRRHGHWPLHDQVHEWVWETVRREGADPHLGLSLPNLLAAAGAAVDAVWGQAIFAGHEEGMHHPLHSVVQAMLPRIIACNVATEADIQLPTLETRLEAERSANASCYVSDMAICVVARRPGN